MEIVRIEAHIAEIPRIISINDNTDLLITVPWTGIQSPFKTGELVLELTRHRAGSTMLAVLKVAGGTAWHRLKGKKVDVSVVCSEKERLGKTVAISDLDHLNFCTIYSPGLSDCSAFIRDAENNE